MTTGGEPVFARVGERTLHEGAVVTMGVASVRGPDGEVFERDLVHHPGAVSAVPLLGDGTVVLVRQYRAAVDGELLEIPAGKRDVPGEPPEVTAGRELEEEIGMRAGRLELLAEFYNSPGFCDERSFVYLATDLVATQADLQGIEEQHLVIERHRLADTPAMVADGRIKDAKTVIGLLAALRVVEGRAAG